jgi:hypothetical protein
MVSERQMQPEARQLAVGSSLFRVDAQIKLCQISSSYVLDVYIKQVILDTSDAAVSDAAL